MLPWILSGIFESKREFDAYRVKKYPVCNRKSQLLKCTICKSQNHKMRVQYGICNNNECNMFEECPRKYKTLTCLKKNRIKFYYIGIATTIKCIFIFKFFL